VLVRIERTPYEEELRVAQAMGAPPATEAAKNRSNAHGKKAGGSRSAKSINHLGGSPPRVTHGGGATSSSSGGGLHLLGMKKIFRRNSKGGGSATDRTGSDDEQGGQQRQQPSAAAAAAASGTKPFSNRGPNGGGGGVESSAGASSSAAGPTHASPGLSTPNRRRGLLFPFQNKRRESNGDGAMDEERSPQATSPNRRDLPTIVLEGVNLLETPRTIKSGGLSPPASPNRVSLFQWQDEMEALQLRRQVDEKQDRKTRDGFCRRVSAYDGVVIEVEGKAAYEMGNYLGGGVAGVVYEGHRLRPMEEYPVRLGRGDSFLQHPRNDNSSFRGADGNNTVVIQVPTARQSSSDPPPPLENISLHNFLCMTAENAVEDDEVIATAVVDTSMQDRVSSLLTDDGNASISRAYRDQEMALEATMSSDKGGILIDTVDAPSRSKHYARATFGLPDDASLQGAMEETVAIKVLNPVGFRLLSEDVTNAAVVARRGEPLSPAVLKGEAPMEERHVWWLINPNSRNLRTLQRYGLETNKGSSRRVEVDRGSAERGLRISLVAAYQENGVLKELPLTRCIEIWGHVPFGASDADFKALLTAIDRINQGQTPSPLSLILETSSLEPAPGRVGTGFTDSSYGSSLEESKTGHPMVSKRTYVLYFVRQCGLVCISN
jgi:hypothetical protein